MLRRLINRVEYLLLPEKLEGESFFFGQFCGALILILTIAGANLLGDLSRAICSAPSSRTNSRSHCISTPKKDGEVALLNLIFASVLYASVIVMKARSGRATGSSNVEDDCL